MIRLYTIEVVGNNNGDNLPSFRDSGTRYDSFHIARQYVTLERPVGVYVLVDDKSGELSIVRVVPDTYRVEVIG